MLCNHGFIFMCEPVNRKEDSLLILEYQHHPHLTVLRCSGRIVHGDGADTLLRAVMSQEGPNLQVDLGKIEAIDASGLGTLVALERWACERDKNLMFTNISKRVLDAIEITRLTPILLAGSEAEGRDDAA